ncbi:MAG: DUF2085 domain-containing protein [Ktedonobacterales bacterium]
MNSPNDQFPMSRPRTRAEVEAALNGISPRRQAFNRGVSALADGALGFVSRHWLALVNGALIAFIGLSVLAPVGYSLGLTAPSAEVFTIYRFFCGQTPSHSFYIAGYQMCLCSRCLAIYSSLLMVGLLIALARHMPQRRFIRPISWKFWVLGMIPMALDGGTQLFGLHESNLFLRLLTGAIFGVMTGWFILPQIEHPDTEQPATPAAARAS